MKFFRPLALGLTALLAFAATMIPVTDADAQVWRNVTITSVTGDIVKVQARKRAKGGKRANRANRGKRRNRSRRKRRRNRDIAIGVGILGAIIGSAIQAQEYRDQRWVREDDHEDWCYWRYRSYRAWDNTFQPYHGRRRQCISPYY